MIDRVMSSSAKAAPLWNSAERIGRKPYLVASQTSEILSVDRIFSGEDEDARLTGGTRSLPRRLSALNLGGSLRSVTTQRKAPAEIAGDLTGEMIA